MKPLTPRVRKALIGCLTAAAVLIVLIGVFLYIRRDDLARTALDPQQPFQTWKPPPAPDYARPAAWALIPRDPLRWGPGDPPADVFFVHPTTYNGGRDWNAPIDQPNAVHQLDRVMLPNYAGPFARVGRVFAPRYRQASLYANLSNRDDSREARRFAYTDVRAAFLQFVAWNHDRPIIVAGEEQGGLLVGRLLDELIAPDPALRQRVAAVYVMDAVVPAQRYAPPALVPACASRMQAHCLVGWVSARAGDPEAARRIVGRAFVWNLVGKLIPLGPRQPLCVNPVTGSVNAPDAEVRDNLGAANATGMEWGARPAFMPRQVSAHCRGGVLEVSAPSSPLLALAGAWADRLKVPPYNPFFADIEADARARVLADLGRTDFPTSAASINSQVVVGVSPIHKVD